MVPPLIPPAEPPPPEPDEELSDRIFNSSIPLNDLAISLALSAPFAKSSDTPPDETLASCNPLVISSTTPPTPKST